MDDIEMREAQLVLVSLQQRWDDERNRSFALIGELDAAERRLLALFSTEWQKRGGDRRTINRAYSEYRKRLMRQFVLGDSMRQLERMVDDAAWHT